MGAGGEGKGPSRVVVHWRRAVFRRSSELATRFLGRSRSRPPTPFLAAEGLCEARDPFAWAAARGLPPLSPPLVARVGQESCDPVRVPRL